MVRKELTNEVVEFGGEGLLGSFEVLCEVDLFIELVHLLRGEALVDFLLAWISVSV